MRAGPTVMVEQPFVKVRSALTAGSAVVTSSLYPTIAAATDSYYMSEAEEKEQILVLTIVGLVVLISPILGIQTARNAISSM